MNIHQRFFPLASPPALYPVEVPSFSQAVLTTQEKIHSSLSYDDPVYVSPTDKINVHKMPVCSVPYSFLRACVELQNGVILGMGSQMLLFSNDVPIWAKRGPNILNPHVFSWTAGGHVDPEETWEQTIIRELYEEAQLKSDDITDLQFLGMRTNYINNVLIGITAIYRAQALKLPTPTSEAPEFIACPAEVIWDKLSSGMRNAWQDIHVLH